MEKNCLFTFIDASELPEVTGPVTAVFDRASGDYTIVINGAGFTDAAADIELFLAGQAQTVLSADASQVVIQVDSLDSGLLANSIDLYFTIGIPNGYTELTDGLTFEPKLLSLSSNTGSQAGSIITAVVKGVGVNDQVTLYDSAAELDIYQSARVLEYGILECITISHEIAVPVELSIKEL